jgi:CRP/FNR family transcriptional regulator, cyclic AMP receptor protein
MRRQGGDGALAEGDRGRLGEIKLLASLPAAELVALEQRCRWRRYHAGEQILDRDSATRDVLFISQGRIRVVNYAASGREIAFAVVEAGGHVGELSAIDGEGRSASLVAVNDCLIGSLSAEAFGALLERHATVAVTLLRHLSRIIRTGDERIAELSVLGAVPRVYRELLRLAEPDPSDASAWRIAELPTQQDIASRVGATRETVARALGQIITTGVVQRHGRTLLIRDREILEELSDPPDAG